MFLLALAIATMPKPVGRPLPGDLGMAASLMAETRPSATRVEVTVDTTGQPVRCEVTVSRGMGLLDRAACEQMMRRARFTPALDASGLPIAAVVRQDFTVNQIAALRRDNGPAAAARQVDFALAVGGLGRPGDILVTDVVVTTDASGRVVTCDVAASSTRDTLDRIACRQLRATTFAPARGRDGTAIAALRQVSVGFAGEVPR